MCGAACGWGYRATERWSVQMMMMMMHVSCVFIFIFALLFVCVFFFFVRSFVRYFLFIFIFIMWMTLKSTSFRKHTRDTEKHSVCWFINDSIINLAHTRDDHRNILGASAVVFMRICFFFVGCCEFDACFRSFLIALCPGRLISSSFLVQNFFRFFFSLVPNTWIERRYALSKRLNEITIDAKHRQPRMRCSRVCMYEDNLRV